jgi:hypothetical protein
LFNLRIFWDFLGKFTLTVWGFTMVDYIAFFDIEFLKFFDSELTLIFQIMGFCFLLIQAPFKIIELNSKRKHNKLVNELKRQELKEKKIYNHDIKNIDDQIKYYDEVLINFKKKHAKKDGNNTKV